MDALALICNEDFVLGEWDNGARAKAFMAAIDDDAIDGCLDDE